jgi:hypothetical protein
MELVLILLDLNGLNGENYLIRSILDLKISKEDNSVLTILCIQCSETAFFFFFMSSVIIIDKEK